MKNIATSIKVIPLVLFFLYIVLYSRIPDAFQILFLAILCIFSLFVYFSKNKVVQESSIGKRTKTYILIGAILTSVGLLLVNLI